MLVTYERRGEGASFEIDDNEGLGEVLTETARELVSRHPELGREPGLVALVAERMLNCLSDNAEDIDLGQLP